MSVFSVTNLSPHHWYTHPHLQTACFTVCKIMLLHTHSLYAVYDSVLGLIWTYVLHNTGQLQPEVRSLPYYRTQPRSAHCRRRWQQDPRPRTHYRYICCSASLYDSHVTKVTHWFTWPTLNMKVGHLSVTLTSLLSLLAHILGWHEARCFNKDIYDKDV